MVDFKEIIYRGYLTRNNSVGIDSVPRFHYKRPKYNNIDNIWESKGIENIIFPAIEYIGKGDCFSVEISIRKQKGKKIQKHFRSKQW